MPRIRPHETEYDALVARVAALESRNATSDYISYRGSATTTTSSKSILTVTHTSTTGRVLVFADIILQTSTKTSHMYVDAGSSRVIDKLTNRTAATTMVGFAVKTVTPNTAITYTLGISSQDSSTTATFPAFAPAGIMVVDV